MQTQGHAISFLLWGNSADHSTMAPYPDYFATRMFSSLLNILMAITLGNIFDSDIELNDLKGLLQPKSLKMWIQHKSSVAF